MDLQDFIEKWEEEKEPLFKFALALTGNREDAKDLLQETAEKALMHYRRFKGEKRFGEWMFTLMRNSFIQDYGRWTETSRMLRLCEIASRTEDRTLEANPEALYGVREISRLLNELNSRSRTPFILYMDGYKYEEIASMLQIPMGTVKHRIFKARQQIRYWINWVRLEEKESQEAG